MPPKKMSHKKTPPKKISELQNQELKFRALLNKRDEINDQAAVLRSERDAFHDHKIGLQEQMNAARDKRDAFVVQMRIHKKKRDDFQAKAKELIEFKKKMKGGSTRSLKDEIRAMDAEARLLELRQQTVPMTIPKERELLETIKKKHDEVERMKIVLAEQEKIEHEVKDMDQSIDSLFRHADKEHAEVVRLSDEQHKAHEEASAIYKDIAQLVASANKKHAEFVKLREEANAVHEKAAEMREKIIEFRKEKRMERVEEMQALRDVNVAVKRALDDQSKKDRAADEALALLLKKGRVEIG
jgi:uncharacterized coiled-coil DUF342 family protein